MFEPVKVALSHYVTRFYTGLMPTTKPMHEFINRGVGKSIVWVPTRMIDSAEEMLAAWQRNDTDSAPTQPYKFPVMIIAMSRDYMPTGADYTRQVTDSTKIIIPDDPKERVFGVRTIAGDIRAQIVIFAADEPTAKSIASQFCLFADDFRNRRFATTYRFAGIDTNWPVQLETDETPAQSIASESKNLVILALDLTLKVEVPLYDSPKVGEPNDGKGIPGTDDPAGYPL
jgi:hypothetical protein